MLIDIFNDKINSVYLSKKQNVIFDFKFKDLILLKLKWYYFSKTNF
jgi:hypothetical protein